MMLETVERRLGDMGVIASRVGNVLFLDKELFLGSEASVMDYDGQLVLQAKDFSRVVTLEKLVLILSLLQQLK